jgi:hypothetical protein
MGEDLPDDAPPPGGARLVYDFDSFGAEYNTLAALGIESDLGFAADEVSLADGDGLFDQLDIVASLPTGSYLKGP